MKRLLISCVLLVCLSLSALFLTVLPGARTPAAHALDLLACTGSQTANYSPGLTNTARSTTVSVHEDYSLCLGVLGLTSGSGSFTVTENADCSFSLGIVVDTVTYHFNNGTSSTVTFSKTVVTRLLDGTTDVTATGTITSGFDQGDLVSREIILPALSITACNSSQGVTQTVGPATLLFSL